MTTQPTEPKADELNENNHYDQIRLEIREKQKTMQPTDSASVLERLSPKTITFKGELK